MYSFVLSTLLSHVTMYPFITIIRQLQTCGENHPMMHDRKENIRQCVVRIWTTQGIRGFYRGFLGYAAVHSFMGLIILEGQTGMRRQ